MPPHHLALSLTAALLLGLLTLGLGLQRGRWKVVRWLHHVLFFAVCAGAGLSALLAWRSGGWLLLPALGALLLMPRTRPGRADHWRGALVAAGLFALGTWAAW